MTFFLGGNRKALQFAGFPFKRRVQTPPSVRCAAQWCAGPDDRLATGPACLSFLTAARLFLLSAGPRAGGVICESHPAGRRAGPSSSSRPVPRAFLRNERAESQQRRAGHDGSGARARS